VSGRRAGSACRRSLQHAQQLERLRDAQALETKVRGGDQHERRAQGGRARGILATHRNPPQPGPDRAGPRSRALQRCSADAETPRSRQSPAMSLPLAAAAPRNARPSACSSRGSVCARCHPSPAIASRSRRPASSTCPPAPPLSRSCATGTACGLGWRSIWLAIDLDLEDGLRRILAVDPSRGPADPLRAILRCRS